MAVKKGNNVCAYYNIHVCNITMTPRESVHSIYIYVSCVCGWEALCVCVYVNLK